MAEKYRRPFLNQAIIRLDFASPLEAVAKALPKKVTGMVTRAFPIAEPEKYLAKDLRITKESTKESVSEGTKWIFHSRDKEKTLTIVPEAIFIIYRKYDSFESVIGDFLPVTSALFDSYKELQGSRIGLRYINKIELADENVFEWGEYLGSNLLSIFDVAADKSKISRAFHNLILNYGDFLISFQYGMHNPDFPSVIRKKVFILDFDSYHRGPLGVEDLSEYLQKFHRQIRELFESVISDKLRELMEPEEDG